MTTREAAGRLGWSTPTVTMWAARAGIRPRSKAKGVRRRQSGKGTRHDFSEADLRHVVAFRRAAQHSQSEAQSARIRRTNPSQYRDPVKLRARALSLLPFAIAASRRQAAARRRWNEQHDA